MTKTTNTIFVRKIGAHKIPHSKKIHKVDIYGSSPFSPLSVGREELAQFVGFFLQLLLLQPQQALDNLESLYGGREAWL